jgi:hypothetical protein
MHQAHVPNHSNLTEPQRSENITIKNARNHLENATFQPLICREINGHTLSTCKVLRALVEHAVKEEGEYAIAKKICEVIDGAPDTERAAKALVDLANSWIDGFLLPGASRSD